VASNAGREGDRSHTGVRRITHWVKLNVEAARLLREIVAIERAWGRQGNMTASRELSHGNAPTRQLGRYVTHCVQVEMGSDIRRRETQGCFRCESSSGYAAVATSTHSRPVFQVSCSCTRIPLRSFSATVKRRSDFHNPAVCLPTRRMSKAVKLLKR
jgi:hypothetical protein